MICTYSFQPIVNNEAMSVHWHATMQLSLKNKHLFSLSSLIVMNKIPLYAMHMQPCYVTFRTRLSSVIPGHTQVTTQLFQYSCMRFTNHIIHSEVDLCSIFMWPYRVYAKKIIWIFVVCIILHVSILFFS